MNSAVWTFFPECAAPRQVFGTNWMRMATDETSQVGQRLAPNGWPLLQFFVFRAYAYSSTRLAHSASRLTSCGCGAAKAA